MVGESSWRSLTGRPARALAVLALLSALLGAVAGKAGAAMQGGFGPAPAPAATAPAEGTEGTTSFRSPSFPVRGAYQYWAGLGDGRGHQGVDLGARCGTPLVAVAAGQITMAKYHYRGGNYLILDLKGIDLDIAYMHLLRPSRFKVGTNVRPGQVIGFVGETGNASGCHLHFETWEGEYYGGGSFVDPMPYLQSWEQAERRKKRAKAKARALRAKQQQRNS